MTVQPETLGFTRNPHLLYCDFHSPTLGGEIRIGWQWDGEEDEMFGPLAILQEIWAGPLDLGIHFDLTSSILLEYELRRYIVDHPGVIV